MFQFPERACNSFVFIVYCVFTQLELVKIANAKGSITRFYAPLVLYRSISIYSFQDRNELFRELLFIYDLIVHFFDE